MSQLRHSGWQHKRGKVGRGARSWRWRKGTITDAVDPERENGAQSSAGAGVQEQLLEAGWESCWGLGRGGSGRGGERVWSQTRSGVKATAAEDEARPGKEPKAEGERQRRKHPGSEPGRRAESREEEGRTVPQEAEAQRGRARQLLRPGQRHREPKQSPGNTGKQLQGVDGMAKLQTQASVDEGGLSC